MKKYNLKTAVAMVVGIIIGAGVFFKSGSILSSTGGNLWLGMLSWIIGGMLIMSSAYAFVILTNDFKISGGVNEYAGQTIGKKYGYFTGFYMAVVYFPCICSVIAWLCAKYTLVLFAVNSDIWIIILSFSYLILFTLLNVLAPLISGKLQVSATIIKLIPLAFIAVAGVIYGLFFENGYLIFNFTHETSEITTSGIWQAICSTVFAYEGWICVTSINNELNDSKRDFPKAIFFGAIICILTYLLYYIGLAGTYPNEDFIVDNDNTVKKAFMLLLGKYGGTILYIFVLISSFGCLNGLCIANIRGFQNLASYNEFIGSKQINHKKTKSGLSYYSAILALVIAIIWGTFWFLCIYNVIPRIIDISELSISFLYVFYIPIYIYIMIKNKNSSFIRRYIIPILAIIASIIIIISGIIAHKLNSLIFLIICALLIFIGFIIEKRKD